MSTTILRGRCRFERNDGTVFEWNFSGPFDPHINGEPVSSDDHRLPTMFACPIGNATPSVGSAADDAQ